ncbi:MAG: 50S ribosomal protein L6 [Candidatus Nitrosocaldus sp.]|nr:50S ribosomal protein L6 [Candidatus Nitrosocaldus sp.]MDW8275525.1 50S ribosomal protein L6 [Candidatus Nitrosocaldus sp.]
MSISREKSSTGLEVSVEVPDGVQVRIDGRVLEVQGPKGKIRRDLSKIPVDVSIDGSSVIIRPLLVRGRPRRKDKAVVHTIRSIIGNMVEGVVHGYTYRLKIVHAHFPISVKVKGREVLVENFIGERSPRVAKIVGDCKVSVEGEDVIVKGVSLDDVAQTAANIENATNIKDKDIRVFLDGIYVYAREKGMQ